MGIDHLAFLGILGNYCNNEGLSKKWGNAFDLDRIPIKTVSTSAVAGDWASAAGFTHDARRTARPSGLRSAFKAAALASDVFLRGLRS